MDKKNREVHREDNDIHSKKWSRAIQSKALKILQRKPKIGNMATHLLHTNIERMAHDETKKWIDRIQHDIQKEKYREKVERSTLIIVEPTC